MFSLASIALEHRGLFEICGCLTVTRLSAGAVEKNDLVTINRSYLSSSSLTLRHRLGGELSTFVSHFRFLYESKTKFPPPSEIWIGEDSAMLYRTPKVRCTERHFPRGAWHITFFGAWKAWFGRQRFLFCFLSVWQGVYCFKLTAKHVSQHFLLFQFLEFILFHCSPK